MKPDWLDRSLVEAPFYYTLAASEKSFRGAAAPEAAQIPAAVVHPQHVE